MPSTRQILPIDFLNDVEQYEGSSGTILAPKVPQTPFEMWPFGPRPIAQNDLQRVDLLEEKVESLSRRIGSVMEDVEEFYAKVNKARQRLVKEDRDAGRIVGAADETREQIKARLRAAMQRQGRA